MTQIDFIMAIIVTLGVISFSIYYVSADFTSQMNEMNIIELKASADVLENQLMLDITEDMSFMKVRFEEISGNEHTENIEFLSSGSSSDYIIYEGRQLIKSGTGTIITPISLLPNQIRYFEVFYSGNRQLTDIVGDNNVSVRALSEQTYSVVSEDLCKNIDYDEMRKLINNNFKIKIGTCDIGLEPPEETVVVSSFPVVLNSLESTIAKIMVW